MAVMSATMPLRPGFGVLPARNPLFVGDHLGENYARLPAIVRVGLLRPDGMRFRRDPADCDAAYKKVHRFRKNLSLSFAYLIRSWFIPRSKRGQRCIQQKFPN